MAVDTGPHPRAVKELGTAKLFAGLDRTSLERLAVIARRLEVGAGETVFVQGDTASALFLLVRGEVKVYKLLRGGRTATLRYVHPGDSFAESALSIDRYPAFTEATAPSVVYRLPVRDFRSLLEKDPELAVAIVARMAELLSLLSTRIEELMLPVPARLARYLLELCEARQALRSGEQSSPLVCRLRMTRRDLAARLGTVPETLSRAFGQLKRAGVLRTSAGGELVEILDLDALVAIAQH